MKKELRDKIIAYNRAAADKAEKAADMEVIAAALAKLPYGQLKKILTDDVLAVLSKYGILSDTTTEYIK